ncbi:hypothetical protein Tco_0190950 [Tanacetum coccineum]
MTPCSHYGHALMLYRSTLLVERHEYSAKIHVRRKLHYFLLIKYRLNEARRSLFRTTCFKPWLDIAYVENDDGMIHYVLQKQCCADDDSFDLSLIYNVNGHNLHFGRCEFCLVTGFKFGMVSFREYRNGGLSPSFIDYFLKKIGMMLKLIDPVLALMEMKRSFPAGLCESLLTLSKEVKSLRGRIFKLESIIHVITLNTNRVEKEESLNKFGPQIEDLLKCTSEDEPDIRDNTSKIVEKDVGDVYSCDVNGHVHGVLMPANPVSQPLYGDFSSDLAVLNGFCNLSQNEDKKGKVKKDKKKQNQSKTDKKRKRQGKE